jgi:hypothetical protein
MLGKHTGHGGYALVHRVAGRGAIQARGRKDS